MTWPRSAAAACLLLLGAAPADAQLSVAGRTLSDTAAPVAGADVVLREAAADGIVARATSDAAGAFVLEVAAPGEYRITVARQGFYSIDDLAVALTPAAALTLTLYPVREHLESLEVTSRGDPVSLTQNASEKALSGAEAMNVPFAGSHSVKNALRTLPGVVQDTSGGVHVDGARESQTLFMLDGFNIGDPLSGGFDPRVSVEAVHALTVRSGAYAAEYGKGSGGVIEVTTSSGGDRLRYSATDFFPTVVRAKGLRVQDWTPRLGVSGPLVKQRAWFANSVIAEYDQWFVEELPRGDDSITSRRLSNHLRTQVNLSASNVLHAGVLASAGSSHRLGLSALDPLSTTRDARSRQWFVNLRDQHVFADGTVIEAGYGSNRTFLALTPRGHEPWIGSPGGRRGNYYYDGRHRSSRDQAIANVYLPSFVRAGTHRLKAGADVDRGAYEQDATRGRIELRNADDRPIRSIAFTGSAVLTTTNHEVAAFVQDTWTAHPRLVVQLGLRTDWDTLTRDWTASPRATAAWSPDDGTKLSGGFAVTHDAARLQLFAAARDQTPVSVYFPPYGPGSPAVSRFVVGSTVSSPRYQTWTATLDRRLPAGIYLHLQGLRRGGGNGLAYFGSPRADADATYTLTNRRTERYGSGEIHLRQSFGPEYGWLAAYTRSSIRSNAVLGNGPDNYFVAADNGGPMPWDAPHRILSWAFLPTFRKAWSASYLLEYRTGFPYSAADSAGFVVGAVNDRRFPDYFDLTVGLERRTHLFGQAWALRASVSNLTNHFNPTTVNGTVESPDFGAFYGGQNRTLAFRVRWLGKAH